MSPTVRTTTAARTATTASELQTARLVERYAGKRHLPARHPDTDRSDNEWQPGQTSTASSTAHIRRNINGSLIKLLFSTTNLRSQIVFLEHAVNDSGSEWLKVSSPVGTIAQVDVVRASTMVYGMLVGGIAVGGEFVYVTNSMPMANLDANEIIEPMERVLNIADHLESELVGGDAV